LHRHSSAQTSQPAAGAFDNQTVTRLRRSSPRRRPGGSGFDWQRLVLAMSVVLTLIFVLNSSRVARSRPRGRPGLAGGAGAVALAAGAEAALLLVQVGRRVIVIGDSAGELTSLSEITDPDEVASLLGQLETTEAPTPAKPFASLFGHARDQYAEPRPNPVDDGSTTTTSKPIGAGEELEQTQSEISGLIDRMRSLTKTMRQ
jgi:flagellar biogenesis protein FliO